MSPSLPRSALSQSGSIIDNIYTDNSYCRTLPTPHRPAAPPSRCQDSFPSQPNGFMECIHRIAQVGKDVSDPQPIPSCSLTTSLSATSPWLRNTSRDGHPTTPWAAVRHSFGVEFPPSIPPEPPLVQLKAIHTTMSQGLEDCINSVLPLLYLQGTTAVSDLI